MKKILVTISIILSANWTMVASSALDDEIVEVELHILSPSESIPKCPPIPDLFCVYHMTNHELSIIGYNLDFRRTSIVITNLSENIVVYSNIIDSPALEEIVPLFENNSYSIIITLTKGTTFYGMLEL